MKLCPTCKACYDDQDAVCKRAGHTALVNQRVGGRVIDGKYRLERLLGHGGTGAVYQCTHLELNQALAIKLLRPDFANNDPNGRLRLRREALTSCNFAHNNLVRLLDYGTCKIPIGENGHPDFYDELYIVMELVEGQTLKDYLAKHGQLTFGEAIEITCQIAAGLAEVHSNGVVHRDLKPANVMLTYGRAGNLIVKVLDFGAVKLIGQTATLPLPDLELTGQMFIGSPQYASPESSTFKPLDGRSDIYCLGLILYEMIAGHRPYQVKDPNPLSWLNEHAYGIPRPLRGVPPMLFEVVMRTLSKRPEARSPSANELRASLIEVRKLMGSAAEGKALGSSIHADDEDELTRVATNPSSGASATRPTIRFKTGRQVKDRVSARTVVALIALAVSVTISLFLTFMFVRNSMVAGSPQSEVDSSSSQKGPAIGQDNEFLTLTDVNIRLRPSGFGEKVGLAEKGSRVKVIEKHKNWRRIRVVKHGRDKEDPNSEDEGWIDGDNLTSASDDRI